MIPTSCNNTQPVGDSQLQKELHVYLRIGETAPNAPVIFFIFFIFWLDLVFKGIGQTFLYTKMTSYNPTQLMHK